LVWRRGLVLMVQARMEPLAGVNGVRSGVESSRGRWLSGVTWCGSVTSLMGAT
jgi:hypothetical protein